MAVLVLFFLSLFLSLLVATSTANRPSPTREASRQPCSIQARMLISTSQPTSQPASQSVSQPTNIHLMVKSGKQRGSELEIPETQVHPLPKNVPHIARISASLIAVSFFRLFFLSAARSEDLTGEQATERHTDLPALPGEAFVQGKYIHKTVLPFPPLSRIPIPQRASQLAAPCVPRAQCLGPTPIPTSSARPADAMFALRGARGFHNGAQNDDYLAINKKYS